jgi:serine/threonine-protein kinase SRPK3
VPKYCVEAAFQKEFDPSLFSGHIKISDFGESFLMDHPPEQTIARGPFILPEFTSPKHMTPAIDVWMFGAAVFQIISGRDLFGNVGDPTKLVLMRFMDTLGKPPSFLLEDWTNFLHGDLTVPEFPLRPLSTRVGEIRDGNRALGMIERREEFKVEDMKALTGFLSLLLRYAPSERPPIDDIMQSPSMAYFRKDTPGK